MKGGGGADSRHIWQAIICTCQDASLLFFTNKVLSITITQSVIVHGV